MTTKELTRKELCKLTGASVNQIDYLRDMRRLPVKQDTTGAGRPIVYQPEAVEIVLQHLGKAPQVNTNFSEDL